MKELVVVKNELKIMKTLLSSIVLHVEHLEEKLCKKDLPASEFLEIKEDSNFNRKLVSVVNEIDSGNNEKRKNVKSIEKYTPKAHNPDKPKRQMPNFTKEKGSRRWTSQEDGRIYDIFTDPSFKGNIDRELLENLAQEFNRTTNAVITRLSVLRKRTAEGEF